MDFKKEEEREYLDYFIDAYQYSTKNAMELVADSERPDFICLLNNKKVGVELSKIVRGNPSLIQFEEIINRQEYMKTDLAIELIQYISNEKDIKRKEKDWKLSENCILLMQLIDIPLFNLLPFLNTNTLPDLKFLGFTEIWLGDYTGLEAYDNIELFCLYPDYLYGYYQRPNPYQKPYG